MKNKIIVGAVSFLIIAFSFISIISAQQAFAQTATTVVCPVGWACSPATTPVTVTTPVGGSGGGAGPGVVATNPTPVTTSTCYVFTNNMTLGSTGASVTALQQFLMNNGFLTLKTGVPTGYFAAGTKAAVAAYQASVGLPATGFVGAITLAKLNGLCTSTGPIIVPVPVPVTSTTTTPYSDVTVEVIGTPTLALTYGTQRSESLLTATFIVAVKGGTNGIGINSGQAPIYLVDSKGNNYYGVRSTRLSMTAIDLVNSATDSYGQTIYQVPPRSTVRFQMVGTTNPQELFAGTYRASLQPALMAEINMNASSGFKLPISNALSTNSKTIVGEVSPYISSITSPAVAGQTLTITGQRLSGDTHGASQNANGGKSTVYINGNPVTSVSFSKDGTTATFTVPASAVAGAYYTVYISNSVTGESNRVAFQLQGSVVVGSGSAIVTGQPTLALTYNSAQKESALTATFNAVVTAGNSSLYLSTASGQAAVTFMDQANHRGSATSVQIGVAAGEKSDAYGRNYTILSPGQSVQMTITATANPVTMFAGSYHATLEDLFSYNGSPSDSPVSFNPIVVSTNQTGNVTIVGELSPYITSVTSPVTTGQTMTITGQRLTMQAMIDNAPVAVITNINSDRTSLSFIVPTSILPGQHYITDSNSSGLSNQVGFTVTGDNVPVTGQPRVSSYSPANGPAGTIITLYGTGFAPSTVMNISGPGIDAQITPTFVDPNSPHITFTLPSTIGSGSYMLSLTNSAGTSDKIPFTVTCPAGYTCGVTGQPNVTASLLNQFTDKAGKYGVFGPGTGTTGYSADWNWTASLTTPSTKTIATMEIQESNGQAWSSNLSMFYPLVVFANGQQLNTSYGQTLGTYQPGTYTFALYGQLEWSRFTGATLTIYFTDGTHISTVISSAPYTPPYGNQSTNQAPVISGGTFPTTLSVGQTGTWTVNASDPQNGSLSYSVDWGDTYTCPVGYTCTTAAQAKAIVQTSTFTHSYSAAGTYTVTFYVQNSAGLRAQTSATVTVGSVVVTPPCPAGYICTQTGNPQPVCPSGYTCTPVTVNCPAGYTCTTMIANVMSTVSVTLDPSSPVTGTIQTNPSRTPNIVLGVFDLKPSSGNATLQSLVLTLNSTGSTVGATFAAVQLKSGSLVLAEGTIASPQVYSSTVTFSNLNFVLPANVSVPLTVIAGLYPSLPNGATGNVSFVPAVKGTALVAIDANSNPMGVSTATTVQAATQTFVLGGVGALSNLSWSIASPASSQSGIVNATAFNGSFTVTAGPTPVYVPKNPITLTTITNSPSVVATVTNFVPSNGPQAYDGSNYYQVAPGSSRTFNLNGTLVNTSSSQVSASVGITTVFFYNDAALTAGSPSTLTLTGLNSDLHIQVTLGAASSAGGSGGGGGVGTTTTPVTSQAKTTSIGAAVLQSVAHFFGF